MKIQAILILLALLSAAARAEEWNPHAGLTDKLVTPWDHKNVKRLEMPQAIIRSQQAMESSAAFDAEGKIVVPHAVPTPIDNKDGTRWGYLEDWRYILEGPGTGSETRRWVVAFNFRDLPQWRAFFGPGIGGDYASILDTEGRKVLHFGRKYGPLGAMTFGAEQIRVNGDRSIELGKHLTVLSDIYDRQPAIELKPSSETKSSIVAERNGQKYLRVRHDGKTYGLRLEPLD